MPRGKISDNDTHLGMAKVSRAVHGPRSIAALIPGVARNAFSRAAPGVGQLMEAWAGIVGPRLAVATTPRRLAQGTLTIGCSGPMAMELQHLSTELIGRINQYLGAQTVHRLRFIQMGAAQTPSRPRPQHTKSVETAASESVSHLPEGPLRSALAALGRAVLTESASRLGKQPRTRS
jgi:hypothetical protein